MKKLLLALLVFTSLYAQEGEETITFDSVFNEIRQDINEARSLNYMGGFLEKPDPEWQLDAFLNSQKAHKIGAQIQQLSQRNKNNLMNKMTNFNFPDRAWPYARDYLALSILAGSCSDTNINSFLERSVLLSDLPATRFALRYGANPQVMIGNLYLLELAKTYPIVKTLVEHGAFIPYQNNPDKQYKLLSKCLFNFECQPQVLEYYRELGINFHNKDYQQTTLLHKLCLQATHLKPSQFFEKFLTLFKAGAVDLNARNTHNSRAIDIITSDEDQNDPTIQLAKRLLTDLEKNPQAWQPQLSKGMATT